ncbi:MAG: RNA polymerase sigma factor [Planctomycetota bacterium]
MTVPEEETRLLEACTRGDAKAWEAFVDRYSPFLFATIRKVLGRKKGSHSTEEAEAVYQDVFWDLYRDGAKALGAFDGRSKLTTYLWVIAYRKTLEYLRGRSRREVDSSSLGESREPAAPGSDPANSAQLSEERALVRAAILDLPPIQREIISLFYFQGKSHVDIAQKTGLSTAAVGMHIFRSRKKLGKILKNPEKSR